MKFIGKLRHKGSGFAPLIVAHDVLVLPNIAVTLSLSSQEKLIFSEEGHVCEVVVAYPSDGVGVRDLGVLARVVQVISSASGPQRIIVDGMDRVHLGQVKQTGHASFVEYQFLSIPLISEKQSKTLENLLRQAWEDYSHLSNIETRIQESISKSQTLMELAYHILSIIPSLTLEQRIKTFLNQNPKQIVLFLIDTMQTTKEVSQLRKDLDGRVRRKMARNQREYYLQEQMKEIQKELGDNRGDLLGVKEFEEKFSQAKMTEEAREKFRKEMKHYIRLQPASPEAGMLRGYLETLLDLPWNTYTEDVLSLIEAEKILDERHFGLEKAKERILDFIAVRKISGGLKSPILCLVGPPGVGKTSLVSSIAQCMGRKFVKLSLGGVRDETEIRGHRRTYVGSLPGKIIQTLQKAQSSNPVFLLDEIDKMSYDNHRGDPANALLEVLDPEQNAHFADTYLEVPYDLSQVLFVATANSLSGVPYPLLDRLDVIELSGYTDLEKMAIAREFILPKKINENGLSGSQITFTEDALKLLIRAYTNESGVRQLEREINRSMRKIVRQKLIDGSLEEKPNQQIQEIIQPDRLTQLLGKFRYQEEDYLTPMGLGMAMGLAWTELGGRALPIEVRLFPGDGKLLLTGKLGEIMKESAQIALSFLKYYCEKHGVKKDVYQKNDIHVHVPEGATPKDGPSAGIALATAMFSAMSGKLPSAAIAMTGEITLTGHLLPIGGLKEKALAAHRYQVKEIVIPTRNRKDIEDIPSEVLQDIEIRSFETADEALDFLFSY
ncbi:MAG: endopeptidase La [Spirochaetia bacterium]